MKTFTTPSPVALTVKFADGSLQILAEDRDTTTVDVAPANASNAGDVDHAAGTTVEQRGNEILVIAPDTKRWFGRTPKLDVRIAMPVDSSATLFVESADIRLTGRLGDTDINTASGDIQFEHVGSITASTASGDIRGSAVAADAKFKSASGDVRVDHVGGTADAMTASGDLLLPAVGGGAHVRTASGDAGLGIVGGSVEAKTASGDIRIESVQHGTVEIDSASGDVWIGIAQGTAAWLEVQSLSGDVTSELDGTDAPDDDAPAVTVRARSLSGDVAIRRAGSR